MRRLWSGIRWVLVAVMLLPALVGCEFGSTSPDGPHVGYAVGPVRLSVGLDGVSVTLGRSWVTPLGTFSVEGGVKVAREHENTDSMTVVIRHTVGGRPTESVFTVGGDRLRVVAQGTTVQEFSPNLVVINATPGTTIDINPDGPVPTVPATTRPGTANGGNPGGVPVGTRTPSSTRSSAGTKPTRTLPASGTALPSAFVGSWYGPVRLAGVNQYGSTMSVDLTGGGVDQTVGQAMTPAAAGLCPASLVLASTRGHPVTATRVLVRVLPINGCDMPVWAELTVRGNALALVTYAGADAADQHTAALVAADLQLQSR
ncbi:hypothetical protein [Yinghuangia seranimata]|uniref:hypothetical protein n=1 Tax=Yinghuangia seranimata TaxID=408067 RepID=UPI00248D3A06|nr:hypothetical protein [Yinghuangia seranimata]MDI2125503.1 hypothetical protein [Yinghuangia seranimata]